MSAPGLGNMAHFRTRSDGRDRRADLTMVLQVIEGVERVEVPALAAIAAARHVPRQLFLKHLREL
jgi:hypothetical protein